MASEKSSGALSALKVKPAYGVAIDEDDDVDEAMRRVMDAYTARQQRNYDPYLMAIGQGLLSSRGNFGEAVGMAAKSYEDVRAKLGQEEADTAAANLQLAQSRRDQALMRKRTEAQQGLFGGESGGVGPEDEMDVDPDAFKLMVLQGADPQVAYQTLRTSAKPAGKRSGITAEKIENYIKRFGPGPEVDAAIKLLVAEDASRQFKDGVLIDTRAGTATRLMPVGLPEVGLDIKDTPTIGGSYPMDSRTRMLYSHVASTGGKEAATKFIEFYKASGVAPPEAEKSYNTPIAKPASGAGQLDIAFLTMAGKLNSVKEPEDLKKIKLNPTEVKIFGALSRIKDANGDETKLSDFDKKVFDVASKLVAQYNPTQADVKGLKLGIDFFGKGEQSSGAAAVPASKAAAPSAAAAPAPAAPAAAAAPAPPVPVAAKAAAAAPAAKAATTSAAPPSTASTAALPPPPTRRANPPALTGVPSAQQIAERESQIKAIDEQYKADMEAWKAQYKTAEEDRARGLNLEQEKKKLEQAAEVAADIEARKDFTQRGKDAIETLATANVMRRFTEDKNFNKMTGVLNDNKISSGIATLIRDGIGSKNFTIGVPAIEEVMRNANLTKAEQATYRTFLMYTAQMQLNAEKAMKGSTTQNERLILGNANISPQDTAEAVRRKADLLTAKAQFDRQASRAFKAVKSKMTAEEFLDSDEYMNMYNAYYEKIAGIASGSKTFKKPESAARATAEPSPGFIFDSKTGVYRRKREGE